MSNPGGTRYARRSRVGSKPSSGCRTITSDQKVSRPAALAPCSRRSAAPVAAQPGHDVAGTHGAARRAGDQAQHLLANLVWEQAAHFPEVVEVEVRDRERMRIAARALELPTGELVKGAPILEPRQVVGAALRALPTQHAHPEIEVVPRRDQHDDADDMPDHARVVTGNARAGVAAPPWRRRNVGYPLRRWNPSGGVMRRSQEARR